VKRVVLMLVLASIVGAVMAVPALADPGGNGRGRGQGTAQVPGLGDEGPGLGRDSAPGQVKKQGEDPAGFSDAEDDEEPGEQQGPPAWVRRWLEERLRGLAVGPSRGEAEVACKPKSFTASGILESWKDGKLTLTVLTGSAVVQGWLADQEVRTLVVVVDADALLHAYGGAGGWEPLDDDDTLGLTNGALVRVYGTARCDDGDSPAYDRFVATRVLYVAPTE